VLPLSRVFGGTCDASTKKRKESSYLAQVTSYRKLSAKNDQPRHGFGRAGKHTTGAVEMRVSTRKERLVKVSTPILALRNIWWILMGLENGTNLDEKQIYEDKN